MAKKILTRAEILAAAANRKTVDVESDRLGGSVRLRELTTAEMFAFRRETKEVDGEESGLHLLAKCWVDESGERCFDGNEGLDALGSMPVEVLNELVDAVLEVNGIGEQAAEAAEKN